MFINVLRKRVSSIVFSFSFLTSLLQAQFYKVYPYQPVEAGEIEFSLWNSYIASSDLNYNFFNQKLSREGLVAHSFELEYGLSRRWGIALYLDYEDPRGKALRHVRTKALMAHYAFFEKGSRPLDIGIYLEYIFNNKSHRDYEEIEIRLILEKDAGALRIDFNPIFEKKTSGPEVGEGVELNYAFGLYYLNRGEGIYSTEKIIIQPGIEFYGKMGEVAKLKPWRDQSHYIFPTLDFFIWRRIKWQTGIGFGLTEASEKIIIKSIFSYVIKF